MKKEKTLAEQIIKPDEADEQWMDKGPMIAGKTGFEAAYLHSVRMSHPAFPVFAYMLGCLVGLCNGARVWIWGSPDPIAAVILNTNHSQTRKSRLTGMAEKVLACVDVKIAERLRMIWSEKEKALREREEAKRQRKGKGKGKAVAAGGGDEEEVDEGGEMPVEVTDNFPGVWSAAYLGGTMERCKERCSGDFDQMKQSKRVRSLPALSPQAASAIDGLTAHEKEMTQQPGMAGRVDFSTGLIFDEVYGFLQDLAMLDTPNKGSSGDTQASGQTPNAGWANRLLQCGKSDHETKTVGCHGGAEAPTVNTLILGNFHGTPCIEMMKGIRGDHGCQTKARVFIATGLPVQPHQEYASYGKVEAKVDYVELPPVLIGLLGLSEVLQNVHTAKAHFEKDAGNDEDEDVGPDPPKFTPNAEGWAHELPDGVTTRIRMHLVNGRHVPEWSIAVRDLEVPEDLDFEKKAKELMKKFEKDHVDIKFSKDAAGAFASLSAWFQIQVKKARDDADINAGAEKGSGPWKLGMLCAMILLWDILWGAVTTVEITKEHVLRAFALLEIFDGINSGLRGQTPPPETPSVGRKADFDFEPKAASCKTDTEIARRILKLGRLVNDSYEASVRVIWNLFTKAELAGDEKLCTPDFRGIADACPKALGEYNKEKDALIFKDPSTMSDDDGYAAALMQFANMKPPELISALSARSKDKRGAHMKEGDRKPAAKKQKKGPETSMG